MSFTYRTSNLLVNQSANSTTIAVSLDGIVAGDLVVVYANAEGAQTTIAISDGTSSFTMRPVVAHTGSLHFSAFGYFVASVASGTVTYTATFGAGRQWRSIGAVAMSSSGTTAFDEGNQASGSGSSASTGNITTHGTDEVVFGGYAGINSGVSFSAPTFNGAALADEHTGGILGIAWWFLSSTATSAVSDTSLPGSDDWIFHAISFNNNGGGGGGRTTKNTRAFPLGMAIGMHRGHPGQCS